MNFTECKSQPHEVEFSKSNPFDPCVLVLGYCGCQIQCFKNDHCLSTLELSELENENPSWNFLGFTSDTSFSIIFHLLGSSKIWFCDLSSPSRQYEVLCFREFDSSIKTMDYKDQEYVVVMENNVLFWHSRVLGKHLLKELENTVDIVKCLKDAFITANENVIRLWTVDSEIACKRVFNILAELITVVDFCTINQNEILYCSTNTGTIWFYWLVDQDNIPLFVLDINDIITCISTQNWNGKTCILCGTASGKVLRFIGNQLVETINFSHAVVGIEKCENDHFLLCFENGLIKKFQPWSSSKENILPSTKKIKTSFSIPQPLSNIPVLFETSYNSLPPTACNDVPQSASTFRSYPPFPSSINSENNLQILQIPPLQHHTTLSSSPPARFVELIPEPCNTIPKPSSINLNQSNFSIVPEPSSTIPQPCSTFPGHHQEVDEFNPEPKIVPLPNSKTAYPPPSPSLRSMESESIFEKKIVQPRPSEEPFRHTKARFKTREKLMNEEKMKSVLESKKKNEQSKSQFAIPSKQTIKKYEEELKLCEEEIYEADNYKKEIAWQTSVLGPAHPKYAILNQTTTAYQDLEAIAESVMSHKVMKIRKRKYDTRKKVTIHDFSKMKEFQFALPILMPSLPKITPIKL